METSASAEEKLTVTMAHVEDGTEGNQRESRRRADGHQFKRRRRTEGNQRIRAENEQTATSAHSEDIHTATKPSRPFASARLRVCFRTLCTTATSHARIKFIAL